MRAARGVLAVALLTAFVAGCGWDGAAPPNLGGMNGTTLDVAVFVNGREVSRLAPGTGTDGLESASGTLPWRVEVRTLQSGRVLLTMFFGPGDLATMVDDNGVAVTSGTLTTVDLSCGRISLWTGHPGPIGPTPDPSSGRPHDCRP